MDTTRIIMDTTKDNNGYHTGIFIAGSVWVCTCYACVLVVLCGGCLSVCPCRGVGKGTRG
eukprot:jgi/Botrbrau1/20038/Bobra.200_1s0043.1